MKLLLLICLNITLLTPLATGMEFSSSAFKNGELIPAKYTCNGDDISPPLSWSGVPENAKSLIITMDDPDAPGGTWDHWVLFNIPATTTNLAENVRDFPKNTRFGQNGWSRNNYGGPCPPDRQHRYFFKIYALDTELTLKDGATKTQILAAMENHILATAELMGRYEQVRKK